MLVFFLAGLLLSPVSFGASNIEPPKPQKEENRITTWLTLSLLGKNQAEIEYYFRKLSPQELEGLRERMRFTVMDNLKRMDLLYMISNSQDLDDLRVVRRKILTEIRYMGMEHDQDLKISIKEEFGISL